MKIIRYSIAIVALLGGFISAQTPKPVKPEPTSQEAEALSLKQVKEALATANTSPTPANIQKALEITDNVGGLDNEAIIAPWLEFCKKHKNNVFTALTGAKAPGMKVAKRLHAVTSWCIENGLEITPASEQKKFEKQSSELQQLIELSEPKGN